MTKLVVLPTTSSIHELYLLSIWVLDTIVADDSSLCQAIDVETKRKAGLSRSSPKPDTETSHAPTLQDNNRVPQAVIPLFNVTVGWP
jgi:hypothetical protein